MLKHKLQNSVILILALIFAFGLIGHSFVNAPGVYAQSGDSDGDGIPDGSDACPNQKGPTYTMGCPEDADGDGVNYLEDACPNKAGPKSNKGCPVGSSGDENNNNTSNDPLPPDTDLDGTPDYLDKCPDVPGDGANGGCPPGVDPNAVETSPQQPAINLIALPADGACVVSPIGTSNVNIRLFPNIQAPAIGTLEVNEVATVLAILYNAKVIFAETEHATNQLGPMFLPPQPDPDDDFPTWVLIQDGNTDVQGWVAALVVRFGGDCSDFEPPEPEGPFFALKLDPAFLAELCESAEASREGEIEILSWSWGETNDSTFNILRPPCDPNSAGDVVPVDTMSINFGQVKFEYDQPGNLTVGFGRDDNLPEVKENDDGTTTVEYCVYEEVHEVGVFEEVCYQIEIPEGCELVSAEAGVYTLDCDDDQIEINLALRGMDLLQSPDFDRPVFPQRNDDGTTTIEYCVYEEVHEAGVFEEVCYQIEIPEGCELVSAEAGVYTLDCDGNDVEVNPNLIGVNMLSSPDFDEPIITENNDGTTTVEYCVYQEVHEVGVFEEVCYQIEIPEGCELVSAEAGVYTLDCDDDDVVVNPALQGMGMLTSPDFEHPIIPHMTDNNDGSTIFEYCVYEEVHEAGVFEEVCYQIEIPEGCELVSAEAGVYTLDCDDDDVVVNPALQGMGMLTSPDFEYPIIPLMTDNDDGSTIFEYCVYEEVHEAGVFEKVCYQIEVPEGCEVISSEAGVYKLDCEGDEVEVNPALQGMDMFQNPTRGEPIPHTVNENDDGTTTIEYCVYLEVHEAGVFEEVCYEIEIPEGCTLNSSEAGVYTLDCGDDTEISLNPNLEGAPAINLLAPEDNTGILIGLLVPAVQK